MVLQVMKNSTDVQKSPYLKDTARKGLKFDPQMMIEIGILG